MKTETENQVGTGAFRAGTLVLLADESEKRIELLKPGDRILSFDDHGDIYRTRVVRLETVELREYCILDFGFERLCLSAGQSVWSDSGWRTADTFDEGEFIREYRLGWHERAVKIRSRVRCGHPATFYSVQLAQFGRFFAGRKAVKCP
jgi:hypothetical protein